MVPKDSTDFSIGLQRGADLDHADIFLHLSARFGHTSLVVRNARRSDSWGVEEPFGKVPFAPLQPFLLLITASLDCFEIEVNGSAHEPFKVRDGLPISSVTHLAIQGGLTVRAIHIPVENMPRNLRLSIPGKANEGDIVFLKGTPPPGAQNFVVNIQSGPGKTDDILFHFGPNLAQNTIALNSRLDDEWGQLEKPSEKTSIAQSKCFDLSIAFSSLGYDTWLDGKEFARFNHRQDLSNASTVFIEGDLNANNIVIDSPQCTLPPECEDGLKVKWRTPRLQVFCPDLPLVSRITGGLDKGCLLLLSGEIPKDPKRFQINLQCDASDDSDIVLQYSPRWDEKDPCLVLNSKEDEEWGTEVRIKENRLGLVPGLHFDLAILSKGEQFQLSVNGVYQGEFPLRLEGARADYVTVSGDVHVQRVLVV